MTEQYTVIAEVEVILDATGFSDAADTVKSSLTDRGARARVLGVFRNLPPRVFRQVPLKDRT